MSEKFPEMDEDFEKLREQWYKTENIAFNIIDCIKWRETGLIGSHTTIRYLKINALTYLFNNFNRWHFFQEPFNLYSSIAVFPNMPMFSYDTRIRKQEHPDFTKNPSKFITELDFFLDIDNSDLRLAYSTAYKIKKIFDKFKIPYYLIFSGKKGFHFKVSWKLMPESYKKLDFEHLSNLFKKFVEELMIKEDFKDLDSSVIDLRRLCKCPYSVVYPYYTVALPLSDEQFNNFSIEDMALPVLIKQTDNFYLRGLLTRKGDPENFKDLIDNYV